MWFDFILKHENKNFIIEKKKKKKNTHNRRALKITININNLCESFFFS